MSHVQPRGHLSEFGPAAGEEPTEQPALAKLLQPGRPPRGRASQPVKDPRQLRRDRGFAVPENPPRVVNEKKIAPQRESLDHAFAGGVETASILNRAEPERFLEPASGTRAGHTSLLGRGQIGGPALRLDVIHTLLDRSVRAGFGCLCEPRGDRVQVDVDGCREERRHERRGDTQCRQGRGEETRNADRGNERRHAMQTGEETRNALRDRQERRHRRGDSQCAARETGEERQERRHAMRCERRPPRGYGRASHALMGAFRSPDCDRKINLTGDARANPGRTVWARNLPC